MDEKHESLRSLDGATKKNEERRVQVFDQAIKYLMNYKPKGP